MDYETTIVCGIICNRCKNVLPPHTMKQHLDGFNQKCPHNNMLDPSLSALSPVETLIAE